MELVASPSLFPGACALGGGSTGPFVDTGRHAAGDERIYIQELLAYEVGEAVGMVRREEYERVRAEAADREGLLQDLEAARDELERLKNAVSTTLARGAVDDGTTEEGERRFRLRPKPGEKKVVLERVK